MKGLCYEFVELESDTSFQLIGKTFGGILNGNALHFDNTIVKGELTKTNLEEGLWIRKWKLTVLQPVTLQRLPAPEGEEKKISLIYFLNPSIFNLKQQQKKVKVNSQHNVMFLSNKVPMHFNVMPNQPFYVLDITFTGNWLLQHFNETDPCYHHIVNLYTSTDAQKIVTEPCSAEEYHLLHELEVNSQSEQEALLFNRSRIYSLICSFFYKAGAQNTKAGLRTVIHYDQVIKAQNLILKNIYALPKIDTIAKKVNMSVSSLLRQFKAMYGKSIYEYCLEKKMELAKKMMIEDGKDVKAIAATLGYKQASPFIEAFTKWHGCSPGRLKTYR